MKFVKCFFLISFITTLLYSAEHPLATQFSCRNIVLHGSGPTEFCHASTSFIPERGPLVITSDNKFKVNIWAFNSEARELVPVGSFNREHDTGSFSDSVEFIKDISYVGSGYPMVAVGTKSGIQFYNLKEGEFNILERLSAATGQLLTSFSSLSNFRKPTSKSVSGLSQASGSSEVVRAATPVRSFPRPLTRSASTVIPVAPLKDTKWCLTPCTAGVVSCPGDVLDMTPVSIEDGTQGYLVLHSAVHSLFDKDSQILYLIHALENQKFIGVPMSRKWDDTLKENNFVTSASIKTIASQRDLTFFGGSGKDGKFTIVGMKGIKNPSKVFVVKKESELPYSPALMTGLVALLHKHKDVKESEVKDALQKLATLSQQVLTVNNSYALVSPVKDSTVEQFEYSKEGQWVSGKLMMYFHDQIPRVVGEKIVILLQPAGGQFHLFPQSFEKKIVHDDLPLHQPSETATSDLKTVFEDADHDHDYEAVMISKESLPQRPVSATSFQSLHTSAPVYCEKHSVSLPAQNLSSLGKFTASAVQEPTIADQQDVKEDLVVLEQSIPLLSTMQLDEDVFQDDREQVVPLASQDPEGLLEQQISDANAQEDKGSVTEGSEANKKIRKKKKK